MFDKLDEMIKILKLKKNLILQGASGVDKTYNAMALALGIIGRPVDNLPNRKAAMQNMQKNYKELLRKGQIGFITFNESLDFEKFVENEIPQSSSEGSTYEIKDGLLKKIVLAAKLEYTKSFDFRWEALIEDIHKHQYKSLDINGKSRYLRNREANVISLEKTDYYYSDYDEPILIEKSELEKFWKIYKDNALDSLPHFMNQFGRRENTTKPEREKLVSIHALLTELKKDSEKYNNAAYAKNISDDIYEKNPATKYVLIIDDINRGNISKIFGETITLLKAENRAGGEMSQTIELPYSNETFSIPPNLYIIGTMNPIERRNGLAEYALHGKFAFYKLKASDNFYEVCSILGNYAADRYEKLYHFIETHLTDDPYKGFDADDLMVGPAYFMANTAEELDLKWKFEIVPIIEEYIRDGLLNAAYYEIPSSFFDY